MTRARYDAVVIGTGPGGAVTARALADAGARVLAVEEGAWTEPGAVEPFSLEQMRRQYRNAGLTVALGRPSVAYTEGMGVGGGSEVNSGLYHRPSAELLAEWARAWHIEALGADDVHPHSAVAEAEIGVRTLPWPLPAASQVLARGAQALGWRGQEVPRWADCQETAEGRRVVEKQTMSVTYWPKAVAAGVELRDRCRAVRLELTKGRATAVVITDASGQTERVGCADVFVCAGAIQTPALLQRSGLRRNIGNNLSVHPTVKVAAEFDEVVNDPRDVPVYQVKEFGSRLSFGGSASRPALLALALSENWAAFRDAMPRWPHLFVYYAAIQSQGRGRVRAVPGFRDPLVTYRITRADHELLRTGLARLTHLLRAAGATTVYPSFRGAPKVTGPAGVAAAAATMSPARSSLMTVHLCGTVPMGEDRARCGADSFGRVHGTANVHVNDAALLPAAPGINPQGTVMAVAARNVTRFLSTH